MRSFKTVLAAMVCVLAGVALAGEQKTTKPTIKNPGFVKRHEGFLEDIKKMNGDINLVFVGDSITDGWRGGGKTVWEKNWAPMKALNLGIGGDKTEHVIWRLQNGELDGYKAKLFVIMIGTNNGGDSAQDVADGNAAIIKEIKTKQPQAKILLLGIFPRGADAKFPHRVKNEQTNALLAKMDDGKTIKYLSINDKFLQQDGTLPKDIMPDLLHPNAKGYEIWAEAIIATVTEMLK